MNNTLEIIPASGIVKAKDRAQKVDFVQEHEVCECLISEVEARCLDRGSPRLSIEVVVLNYDFGALMMAAKEQRRAKVIIEIK